MEDVVIQRDGLKTRLDTLATTKARSPFPLSVMDGRTDVWKNGRVDEQMDGQSVGAPDTDRTTSRAS